MSLCLRLMLAFLALAMCTAYAQDALPPLLLHPETVFVRASAGPANFVPMIDGQPVPLDKPQILFQRSTDQADFVAAVWKDAQGKKKWQREVFVVKPDYAIVVDYLYGVTGVHPVTRLISLPSGEAHVDATAVNVTMADGKIFRAQANDKEADAVSAQFKDGALLLSSQPVLPAPIPTIFMARTTLLKFAYVKPANQLVVKFEVTFPNGREDAVSLAWESRTLHTAGKPLVGWAVCVRKGPGASGDIEIKP